MIPIKSAAFILSVFCLFCTIKAENCPDGWVRFHESCYLFADEHGFDWTEAEHFCNQHSQAHLVMVESFSENALLMDYAHRLFKAGRFNAKFWMGASDEEIEGLWVWIPNHKPLPDGYTHWAPGQPQHGTSNEDCLCLHPPNFDWHDCYCTEKNHPLCEKNTTADNGFEVIG